MAFQEMVEEPKSSGGNSFGQMLLTGLGTAVGALTPIGPVGGAALGGVAGNLIFGGGGGNAAPAAVAGLTKAFQAPQQKYPQLMGLQEWSQGKKRGEDGDFEDYLSYFFGDIMKENG